MVWKGAKGAPTCTPARLRCILQGVEVMPMPERVAFASGTWGFQLSFGVARLLGAVRDGKGELVVAGVSLAQFDK